MNNRRDTGPYSSRLALAKRLLGLLAVIAPPLLAVGGSYRLFLFSSRSWPFADIFLAYVSSPFFLVIGLCTMCVGWSALRKPRTESAIGLIIGLLLTYFASAATVAGIMLDGKV